MPLLENGDFSNGLDGWRVSEPVGGSAPTFDPENERVVFGNASNDVNNGDTLEQDVALTEGEEYTLTFTMAEVGDSPFSGFGLTIDLIRVLEDGTVTTRFRLRTTTPLNSRSLSPQILTMRSFAFAASLALAPPNLILSSITLR